jgi:hypothetical protein
VSPPPCANAVLAQATSDAPAIILYFLIRVFS